MELKKEKLIKKDDYYLYYMSQSEIPKLREEIYNKNNKKCGILGIEIPLEDTALDHKHKLKSVSPNKIDGAIRDTLHKSANALAGKIENNFKRYFGSNPENQPINLSTFLRNMADYLERGSYSNYSKELDSTVYYIHPNETPKRKKHLKSELNLIEKWYFIMKPKARKLKKFNYITEESQALLEQAKQLKEEFKNPKNYLKLKESNENYSK